MRSVSRKEGRKELDGAHSYIPCQRIQKSRPGRERTLLYDGAITQAWNKFRSRETFRSPV